MLGVQRTRTLLGPADPARDADVAAPRIAARELIARAGASGEPATGRHGPRATRRLVLAAGTLAVAVAAAGAIRTLDLFAADGPQKRPGVVLLPVAYQFDSGAAPAGDQLRTLAGRLVDAPHDNRTGRYLYHHTRTWGDPVQTSADGRYHIAYADETKVWRATDGSGRQTTVQLGPQFPDQGSRDFWQRSLEEAAADPPPETGPPPRNLSPLPSDRRGLIELLKVEAGAGAVAKQVGMVYGRHAVPRQTRAEMLRVLADVPGFLWRGEVTDRAGRPGVAITFDDRENDAQSLLIFEPRTGELLAQERLTLSPVRLSTYQVILKTDWTDQAG